VSGGREGRGGRRNLDLFWLPASPTERHGATARITRRAGDYPYVSVGYARAGTDSSHSAGRGGPRSGRTRLILAVSGLPPAPSEAAPPLETKQNKHCFLAVTRPLSTWWAADQARRRRKFYGGTTPSKVGIKSRFTVCDGDMALFFSVHELHEGAAREDRRNYTCQKRGRRAPCETRRAVLTCCEPLTFFSPRFGLRAAARDDSALRALLN
jgi:hypothetical protein